MRRFPNIRYAIPSRIVLGLILLCLAIEPKDLWARDHPLPDDRLCDRAAQQAAAAEGIPTDLLRAVAEVEAGRREAPQVTAWPWSLNVAGTAHRYPSRRAAIRAIETLLAQGIGNFDVGCFQVNHAWHGREFSSAEAMLDPWQNAAYAARFLKALHAEFGDWTSATGAYHSRTEALARRYVHRVGQVLARLHPSDPAPPLPALRKSRAARMNSYPLLTGGTGASAGSLVPSGPGTAARRPMF